MFVKPSDINFFGTIISKKFREAFIENSYFMLSVAIMDTDITAKKSDKYEYLREKVCQNHHISVGQSPRWTYFLAV